MAHTDALKDIVLQAGKEILQVYNTEFAVQTKQDESPLTQADLAAHQVIVAGLQQLTPGIPIISEESELPAFSERSQWQRYWLVDPLDGTKEFVSRNGEFTVNIALIEDNAPALGWVGVPVQGRLFFGNALAGEAWVEDSTGRRPLRGKARQPDDEKLTVVASRNHGGQRLEDYLAAITEQFPSTTRIPVGSSLKLCTLASGEADIYPRLGPTSEWDIGAAQAVLCAAGGRVFCADGESLGYNQKENILNPEFIAVADGQFPWAQVLPQLPSTD
ncbi:MAG: 3'(2'),5'-bisphosphate nucleotidase CysQ [Pseudomonadota bacterium]|nr:3'(2'),5'-bisphosphate nucleotidase CysQ [Pseudomonadota bacterium]MEC7250425.1 3'(2'),5'-bisphosphate nucleotidase CysQ [Pseudomonadota bacterium]MEC7555110.1 3'(2'),5'-bisphosphate nucleotidase CysQ [Pseudomonadota bacterium]MEC7561462.1 3'(2'),5'-bisphosphate nucleotidase CysQ [Pseudomonadota bacterium]MEC7663676.1 3'(2'),5'-bisphosphate nucleotidase CysQ [Pseudomonadota bacterium]